MTDTKRSHGNNYRRHRKETKFDTLTLAHNLKHEISVYIMNESRVPKRWRYMNGKPAIDYARYIRDCISMANDIWIDTNVSDNTQKERRRELQAKALSYCNILQLQLIDICAECDGATEDSMRNIINTLNDLIGKIKNWSKSDNDRIGI